jgi:hypothetical protein
MFTLSQKNIPDSGYQKWSRSFRQQPVFLSGFSAELTQPAQEQKNPE